MQKEKAINRAGLTIRQKAKECYNDRTPDGRYFDTGVPVGFSDIFGLRESDGRAFFIEVKTKKGRLSPKQKIFLEAMQSAGAIAGVCRSKEDAKKLIKGE